MEIHKLYQKMYEQLEEFIDDTIERIRTLGHYAQGRLKNFIEQTHLVGQNYTNKQQQQFRNLLDDYETIIRNLRQLIDKFADEYDDAANADYLTGLMEDHEKMAWFLRNYIQKQEGKKSRNKVQEIKKSRNKNQGIRIREYRYIQEQVTNFNATCSCMRYSRNRRNYMLYPKP